MANIKDLIKSIEAVDSSFDEKLAAINQMEQTLVAMRQQEEQAVQDNVDLIVEAIKVMERKVESQIEIAKSIVPEKGDKGDKGERGLDGANGRDGKDGRDGINGSDGQDGKDGVSVSDAKIDFDGSLIITLSTGQEINVGEVVAPELQEKIKLVTSGGAGTVLPNQAGNSGKVLGTDGSTLSWVTGGGGGGSGTVTSVAATAGTGISVTGSPITSSGTLNITNTAPDQTVSLTGAGTTAITGTYPNFTVTSNDAYVGTVTSVGGTGTVNGLTLTGTVTSSGNLTLGGTLNLSSPPAIGGTTPAAISATTLSLTGTTNQISSVAVSSDPAAPSAGNLKTFTKTIAGGYTAPAFLNATQAVAMLQPAIANKKIGSVGFSANTTLTISGMGTFSGTATSVTYASTNFYSRIIKTAFNSTGTAGTFGNYYQTVAWYQLGVSGTPNFGGFYYVVRFGIGDAVASPRTFVGLSSTTSAPTNVEPSTLTNSIGVGQGASDTNLKIYYGGSAAQTAIDLGANFPTNTNSVDWYELTLFAPPSSTNTVYYQVIRLNTGNVASGTLTGTAGTVLPANTTALAVRNWRTNNATASAVTLHLGSIYMETDY